MRRIITVLVLFFLAMQVWAQERELKLPPDLPPYGPLKPMSSPKVQEEHLSNGLTVWLVPRAGFPKVTFLLTVRGGFAADPPTRPGIAEFLADTVNQGTKNRTVQEIAQEIQAAGGELQVKASTDSISLEATVLASRADPALSVLADVAQNADFPAGQVEIVRKGLENSLQRQMAEPAFLARHGLAAAMFGDQPYAVLAPTQATMKDATVEELRSEYARRFRPDQAMLLVIGDFEVPPMFGVIRQRLGAWKPEGDAKVAALLPQKQEANGTLSLIPRANSVQTRFMMASLGPKEKDPDYAAARVATLVCGRRISRNIREDKGYAYSAGADVLRQGEANLLLAAATVRNPVTGATWNELRYELDRMATTAPTASEVDGAKHFLIGYEALNLQPQAALAERLGELWTMGLDADQIGKEGEALEKVTAADVERIGRERLAASQMTAVAVGDGSTIEEQITPLGIKLKKTQK
ncbi:MAG: pitrilysin family protein [Terriglobia bacterium]|nr:pitrilysin family protein [Terriglobia bacterium]